MIGINSRVIGVVVEDLDQAAGSALGICQPGPGAFCLGLNHRPDRDLCTLQQGFRTDKQLPKQLPPLRNINAFRYHCPLHYRAGDRLYRVGHCLSHLNCSD